LIPKSTFISKNRAKKIRQNFSLKRFFMSKGFKPTEHKKSSKNMKAQLERKTKEFKNVLRNPVVVAANLLDKSANHDVE
tara:strand:+ start:2829 stop:3065 length:237 start_codon:yes stop_codon:yes gene_type:complete